MSRLLVMVPAALATLGGCGARAPRNTPETVGQAFADAMGQGDTGAAAKLWDYVTEARSQNPDWDEIPSGQRGQIISKLKSEKAEALAAQTGLFSKGMKTVAANTSGAAASLTLDGGPQGGVVIQVTQSDGQWGVSGFSLVGGG